MCTSGTIVIFKTANETLKFTTFFSQYIDANGCETNQLKNHRPVGVMVAVIASVV